VDLVCEFALLPNDTSDDELTRAVGSQFGFTPVQFGASNKGRIEVESPSVRSFLNAQLAALRPSMNTLRRDYETSISSERRN
jgi:hypothetical protein